MKKVRKRLRGDRVLKGHGFEPCVRSYADRNGAADAAPFQNSNRRFAKRRFCAAALALFSLLPVFSSADCLPINEAHDHIGETQCITGKVIRVKRGTHGTTFFDFCDDFRVCPFTVVIFRSHLKDIGDVRQLADKVIEVHGPVKAYDGRAEIVVTELRQLGGAGARIPKLPKDYDVERKGKYSAGSFSLPKPAYTTSKKRQPATLPAQIPSVEGAAVTAENP